MYSVACLHNRFYSSRERVSVLFLWPAGELIETDSSQIWSSWLFHLLVAPWKALFTQDKPWLSTAVEACPSIHSQSTPRITHPHSHCCHLSLLVLVKGSSRLPPPSIHYLHESAHCSHPLCPNSQNMYTLVRPHCISGWSLISNNKVY